MSLTHMFFKGQLYRLWVIMIVIMIVGVGLSIVTNVPLWWRMLIMGKAMPVLGQEVYGKSL